MNQPNLSSEDWRLIQDCVVDKISDVKHRQQLGYAVYLAAVQVERLEKLLGDINPYTIAPPSGWKWSK